MVGGARHVPRVGAALGGQAALLVLRRPAVRDGAAALRAHPGGHDQGHRVPLRPPDRAPRAAALRLGLPRAADRARDRQAAQDQLEGGRAQDGDRHVQQGVPLDRDALLEGVGGDGEALRPVDRLRERLQDDEHVVHGERVVGVQDAAREGPRVPRLQGDAVLVRAEHAGLELRGPAELQGGRRPRRRVRLPAGRRAGDEAARVDDDAVDAAVEPRALRPPREAVREGEGRGDGRRLRHDGGADGAGVPRGRRPEEEEGSAQEVHRARPLRRRRPRGEAVLPAVRLLRVAARGRRVPRHHRRLCHRGRRLRHRALRAGVRRGGLQGVPDARRDPQGREARVPDRRQRAVHVGGARLRRQVRQGRRQGDHQAAEGARQDGANRRGQALVPVLLAVGHAAHLPRRPLDLHQRRVDQTEAPRQQRQDVLGARLRQGEALPQLARGRARLGGAPQPLLGDASSHRAMPLHTPRKIPIHR